MWAGSFNGVTALSPPQDSYASNPASDVVVLYFSIAPGGKFTLPAAAGGSSTNRKAYFIEGDALSIGSDSLKPKSAATLDASQDAVFLNTHSSSVVEILVLQGKPIGEPVVQHGPFVMNTQEEIMQAFSDYRRTQFGGWPWPEDAVVFPRTKGRFSLQDKKVYFPPSTQETERFTEL